MSIPTSVFENGRWVTRYEDIHHVLARNRNPEAAEVEKAAEITKPPSLGLLSRTIIRSPVVKWIIPARIRHPDKNDVLYITADSVEIKEAHGDYTLHHVVTRDDFDSPIRAAKICGLHRGLTKPDINAIIRREEHWRDDVHYNHPDHVAQPMDGDTQMLIKEEDDGAMTKPSEGKLDDVETRSLQAVPLYSRTMSPHILILALESGTLVFMYNVNGDAATPHLVTCHRPLWKGQRPILEQIGQHVAVDPRSRAIAVASQEKYFYLYAMRSMEYLQQEVTKRSRLDPIISERAFEVDGTIVKMEFLFPPQDDHGQVILLLVVCKNGKSRLVCYEWISTTPLALAQIKPISQTLPNEERLPLLLIPTTAFTAFILVCENRIVLYKDLLTGTPSRYIHSLHHRPEPEEPGTSRKSPIWVQWARVVRSATHRAQGDCVYLCREDGIVHFLDLKNDRPGLIDSTHQVGKLGINIDTSFAVLDIGPHSSDLLAVGGDGSEGGLWRFDARKHAKKVSNDPNWTPVIDCCTAIVVKQTQKTDVPANPKPGDQQRMFACVGKSKQGAISEIRYGIPALKNLTVDLKDILSSGILAVWAFHNNAQATSYIILSHPKQTYLLRIRQDADDEDSTLVDIVEESQALQLNERTIAAKATSEGRIIQITERSVQSASFLAIDGIKPEDRLHHDFAGARVITACIGAPEFENLTLIAFDDHEQHHLQLAIVDDVYKNIGDRLRTGSRATAVALTCIGHNVFAFVGNVDGAITVFVKQQNSKNLERLLNDYEFEGDFAICESIALSTQGIKSNGAFTILVACGLRNGTVEIFQIHKDTEYRVDCCYRASFGRTPVNVMATTPEPVRFIAHCEDRTCGLECRPSIWTGHMPPLGSDSDMATVHRIWVTEDKIPEWHQGHFLAITIAETPEAFSISTKAPDMVCVDRTSVHVASLDYAGGAQNVHRRLNIGGTPIRAVYSKHLGKLIVLNNRISVIRHPRTVGSGTRTQAGKRALQPAITFVELDKSHEDSLDDDAMDVDVDDTAEISRQNVHKVIQSPYNHENLAYKPGERFLGVTEWFPKLEDREFHMLLVNTIVNADETRPATGRLLLFGVQSNGDHIGLTLKKEIASSVPVYAVATHPDRRSIVYCCGRELCIMRLEDSVAGPKWSAPIKSQLRSPGRYITFEMPYIYVSTAGESLAVFQDMEDHIEYSSSDTIARQCLHHINIPSLSLIITADMGGSITGLWQPPSPARIDNSLSTVFEASLPHTVIRLHSADRPIWLSDRKNAIETGHGQARCEWLAGERVIIGTSTTGTVTQHTLLEPHRWPLLRFVQNVAERSPVICPFRDVPLKKHLDPAWTTKPESRAINGDILMRLLDRGSLEVFSKLMNKSPISEERYMDFDSTEERWAKFRELSTQFLGSDFDETFQGRFGNDGKLSDSMVMMAIRNMLKSVL